MLTHTAEEGVSDIRAAIGANDIAGVMAIIPKFRAAFDDEQSDKSQLLKTALKILSLALEHNKPEIFRQIISIPQVHEHLANDEELQFEFLYDTRSTLQVLLLTFLESAINIASHTSELWMNMPFYDASSPEASHSAMVQSLSKILLSLFKLQLINAVEYEETDGPHVAILERTAAHLPGGFSTARYFEGDYHPDPEGTVCLLSPHFLKKHAPEGDKLILYYNSMPDSLESGAGIRRFCGGLKMAILLGDMDKLTALVVRFKHQIVSRYTTPQTPEMRLLAQSVDDALIFAAHANNSSALAYLFGECLSVGHLDPLVEPCAAVVALHERAPTKLSGLLPTLADVHADKAMRVGLTECEMQQIKMQSFGIYLAVHFILVQDTSFEDLPLVLHKILPKLEARARDLPKPFSTALYFENGYHPRPESKVILLSPEFLREHAPKDSDLVSYYASMPKVLESEADIRRFCGGLKMAILLNHMGKLTKLTACFNQQIARWKEPEMRPLAHGVMDAMVMALHTNNFAAWNYLNDMYRPYADKTVKEYGFAQVLLSRVPSHLCTLNIKFFVKSLGISVDQLAESLPFLTSDSGGGVSAGHPVAPTPPSSP